MSKVSVITPVYNGAQYLGIAIDSLLAQTLTDWELIVVDDGSTDTTPQVLDAYNDPRILRIRQANAGEATARNNGLSHATGEYVAWLDADDLYLPNALSDLAAFLDVQRRYDVAFSDGYICNEKGEELTRLTEHRPGILTGDILEPLVLSAGVVTVPVCTMTRRDAIELHGIRFDKNLVIGPDWDFWIQLARHVQFGYLDEVTCMYRIHLSNITRKSGQKRRNDDLVYGRMKVMSSTWFNALSVPTRYRFFYQFLIELLVDQPERQKAILEGEQLCRLPVREQAELWRHTGVSYFRKQKNAEFAIACLREACRLWPGDIKSRCVLWTIQTSMGRSVAPRMLYWWERIHRWVGRLRSPSRRQPKPVPSELRPIGD